MSAAALRAPRPFRALGWGAVLLAVLALCAWRVDFDPSLLVGEAGREQFVRWWERFRTPDTSSEVLGKTLAGARQTLSIAIVGTAIGAAIAFVLMAFSSRALLVAGPLVDEEGHGAARRTAALAVHQAARLVANALRTVPYLVWAIFFVLTVGLGPFPGALAIGLHTGGVLGRLFSTALDDVDPRAPRALLAAGAPASSNFWWSFLPAARPALLSYVLYRFEVNVREAAVLGVVGAGGLGQDLYLAMNRFDYEQAGTYLLAIMALVLAADFVSAKVRARIL
jgi:phosphonate transport system permease protein